MKPLPAHADADTADQRSKRRDRADLWAIMRQQQRPNEAIRIVDLSTHGCGFRSRREVPVGRRIWLALPGIETWAATVAWWEGGKGGLRFERPLDPAIAASLAGHGAEGG